MSSRSNSSPQGGGGRCLKDEGTRLQVVAAGAVSGLISRFVIAPLDVIKIRLQLQSSSPPPTSAKNKSSLKGTTTTPPGIVATTKHILATEGPTAFWKGNVPAELLYVCYSAAQFTAYRSATLLLRDPSLPFAPHLPPAAESFVSGAVAGVVGIATTYPLDLLRTRFAAQGATRVYPSLGRAVASIARDEGIRGFFRGLAPTLGQIAPHMGIFFATYETARPACSGLSLPFSSGDAAAGVLAGVVAKTAVFPLDLVKKRIQVQGPTRSRYAHGDALPEYTAGATRALMSIVRTEGVRGLYRGLTISLVKAAPASAVIIWTYERALGIFIRLGNDRGASI